MDAIDALAKRITFVDIVALDRIEAATVEELAAIPGIGYRTAEAITQWFKNPKNREMLQKLRLAGVIGRT